MLCSGSLSWPCKPHSPLPCAQVNFDCYNLVSLREITDYFCKVDQSRLFLVSAPQETDSLNTSLSPQLAAQGHARTVASLCPEPPTLRFSPSSLLTGWAQKGQVSGREQKVLVQERHHPDHLNNLVLIPIVCVFFCLLSPHHDLCIISSIFQSHHPANFPYEIGELL